MRISAAECRFCAADCQRLAREPNVSIERATALMSLAQSWERLADDMGRYEAIAKAEPKVETDGLPLGRPMLPNLTREISECYQHANSARDRAEQTHDAVTKQDLLDMERRWLSLAHSYELAEWISDFSENIRRPHK